MENNQSRAYRRLKERILKNELKPGAKVSKKDLVHQLGIGETPVREAILRLQKEGLMTVIPQSGTYISKIDLQEVYEARFVRENIEEIVAQEVAQVITPVQLAELENKLKIQQIYFEARDHDHYFQLDEEFHQTLYEIANKQHVWEWLQLLNTALNRFRYLRLEVAELGWDNILKEHREIVALIASNDQEALGVAIRHHIHKVNEDAEAVVAAFPTYFTSQDVLAD